MDDSFLIVAEIARLLKLNRQTVRNRIDAGKLPAMHVGRRVRVKRSDFDRLVEESYVRPGAGGDRCDPEHLGVRDSAARGGGGMPPDRSIADPRCGGLSA
jgi:excisionase family DNA binding protein